MATAKHLRWLQLQPDRIKSYFGTAGLSSMLRFQINEQGGGAFARTQDPSPNPGIA
jgi:hypothetical protein